MSLKSNYFTRKNILAFVHIKKCAGTTLEHILRINFFGRYCEVRNLNRGLDKGSNAVFEADDMRQIFLINPLIKCIAGHTLKPFGSLVHSYPNITFITFLRNPIKRYISQFLYNVHRSGDTETFEQYLNRQTIFNKQTKTIAGTEDLSKAKQIINDRFLLVGIVEEFDESLVLLRNKLAPMKFLPNYIPRNIGQKTSQKNTYLQKHLLRYTDIIQERNHLDIELYKYVRHNLLPQEKKNYGPTFNIDLAEFRQHNKNLSRNFLRYLDYVCRKCYYIPLFAILRKYNQLTQNNKSNS